MTQEHDRSRCIYCGAGDDMTSDHVPPKNLFPEPRTSDLITVPACRPCNKDYELDDEYFRLAMTVAAEENPVALQLWREKGVRGTLRHSPHLRAVLLKRIGRLVLQTPAGLYLGWTHTIAFDRRRVDRVIFRTVTGLHWHELGTIPRAGLTMRAALGPDPRRPGRVERAALTLLAGRPWRTVAGGIFRYAFDVAHDRPDCSAWLMVFYSAALVLVTVTPPEGG
jgi:hypothetical protein